MTNKIMLASLFILISACSSTNSGNEDLTQKAEEYFIWRTTKGINIDVFRGTSIDENNTIHIYGDDIRLISNDGGNSFQQISAFDSVRLRHITFHNGTYTAKGEFHQSNSKYGLPDSLHGWLFTNTNSLFTSTNGLNWARTIGPFTFETYQYQNDSLVHFAIDEGIRTVNLNTMKYRDQKFIFSKWIDRANVIHTYDDGRIIVGSHDGIHKSSDFGNSWKKVSTPFIQKDDDFVNELHTIGDDTIISVGKKTYLSDDKGESWNELLFSVPDENVEFSVSGFYDTHLFADGTFYGLFYYGMIIANIENPLEAKLAFKYPETSDVTSRYDELIALQNGDVLLFETDLNNVKKGIKLK